MAIPSAPVITVANTGTGTSVTVTFDGDDTGIINTPFYKKLSATAWSVGDSRGGDGDVAITGLTPSTRYEFIGISRQLVPGGDTLNSVPSVPVHLDVVATGAGEWQIQFEQALVTTLGGNSTLTALLASTTSIYYQRPFATAAFPHITFSYRDDSPQSLAGRGKVDVALQMDIWTEDTDAAAIRKALQDLMDDRERIKTGLTASPLTMTNWGCKHFRYLRGFTIPTGEFRADTSTNELVQHVTEWSVRLYRTDT